MNEAKASALTGKYAVCSGKAAGSSLAERRFMDDLAKLEQALFKLGYDWDDVDYDPGTRTHYRRSNVARSPLK